MRNSLASPAVSLTGRTETTFAFRAAESAAETVRLRPTFSTFRRVGNRTVQRSASASSPTWRGVIQIEWTDSLPSWCKTLWRDASARNNWVTDRYGLFGGVTQW